MKPSALVSRSSTKAERKSAIRWRGLCCLKSTPEQTEPNRTIQVHTIVKTDSMISKLSVKGKNPLITKDHSPSDNEMQPSSPPFRFLDLPRQVRNIVYLYTLQYDGILSVAVSPDSEEYTIKGRNFDSSNGSMRPLENVFALVNKQLREETRDLFQKRSREIKVYERNCPLPSSYAFWTFVTEPAFRIMRDQIRTIYVTRSKSVRFWELTNSTVDEIFACLAEFKLFCEENPEIDVIVRFRGAYGVDKTFWYQWVATFHELLRGWSPLILPHLRRHTLPLCSNSLDELRVVPCLPDNLRFSIQEMFPEVQVEDDLRFYQEVGEISEDEVVKLKGLAKWVFEKGI